MELDFEKAFDRVDHNYLWATLVAMDLDPFVTTLIQGLVYNAEAKVHVSGLFTLSFPLERGVWQGDPMSPLLFALSSEPLMCLLEDKSVKGELKGLRILDQENLLFQLFADDAGLPLHNSQPEFENARATIQIFENILGAFLNVAKSVIIPLVNLVAQTWFGSIGCLMLPPHETTKYLGWLIGFNVSPLLETEFLLGKVQKRLSHWANRVLSFTGRVVRLLHVIRAMPIYHMMSMTLNSKLFKDLESIARDFLWGTNEDGETRKALVAWKDMTLNKAEGGVGFEELQDVSRTLKMRWFTRILLDALAKWAS